MVRNRRRPRSITKHGFPASGIVDAHFIVDEPSARRRPPFAGLAVVGYLVAVVLANLGAYYLGPGWVPAIGFVAIGFDLTCRDILHERWHGGDLKLNMALLILAGSVLTKYINPAAEWVALASMLAFGLSAVVDSVIFEKLFHRARLVRINGSNLGSAAVDSVVFPTVAFGLFMPWIIVGQFLAKVAGGFLWSLVLTKGDRHAARDQ